jgi:peptide/nickel transport system ATP-binding protein
MNVPHALLDVRNLHLRLKLFEGDAHILKGVHLRVNRGEKVAVVGESGCGKSVTMRVLLRLLPNSKKTLSGTANYAGTDLLACSERELRRLRGAEIAMIFQDPMAALNPVYTIGTQMTTIIRQVNPSCSRQEARRRAAEALREVHIEDAERVMQSYPFQLSGGMNQRVLIAIALVNRPKLVIADEPGTALDVTVQAQTLRLMRQLVDNHNAGLLLITHNLAVVREMADRVYVMYAGTVVEEGDVATVFANPKHPYTRALMDAVPKLSGTSVPEGIEGTVPDYTQVPPGCRFLSRCPHANSRCHQDPPYVPLGENHHVACVLYEEREVVS